jgi:ankyrin repeat protein
LQYAISIYKELGFSFEEFLNLLAGHGFAINNVNEDGYSALHFAIEHGLVAVVEILLDYPVDINLQDKNGFTPIYLAIANYRGEDELLQIIKLLLNEGADIDIKNNSGLSARDVIINNARDIDEGSNPASWDLRGKIALP